MNQLLLQDIEAAFLIEHQHLCWLNEQKKEIALTIPAALSTQYGRPARRPQSTNTARIVKYFTVTLPRSITSVANNRDFERRLSAPLAPTALLIGACASKHRN